MTDDIIKAAFRARAREGGLKAAANMTPEQRKARARKGAEARWRKDSNII